MEKPVGGFAVLGALLVLAANVSTSQAQTVNVYFTEGGELRVSPVPVTGPITSIVWKYYKNLLAEWAKDSIPLTYYSKFKGRSELNTNTGDLVVQNMTAADNGVYSVEINNKVQSQVYQTVQIGKVPRPTVELQPIACDGPQQCALKCHGDVSKAEPVSYFWKKDGGEWERGEDKKNLSAENIDRVKTFFCRMKNPVSQEDSDPFSNRFYTEEKTPDGPSVGAIVGGVIGALILVAIILIVLGFWKKDELGEKFPCLKRGAGEQSTPKDKDDQKPENGNPTPESTAMIKLPNNESESDPVSNSGKTPTAE